MSQLDERCLFNECDCTGAAYHYVPGGVGSCPTCGCPPKFGPTYADHAMWCAALKREGRSVTDQIDPADITVDSPPDVLQTFIWERVLDMETTGAADDRRVKQAGLALALLKHTHPAEGAKVEAAIQKIMGWAQEQLEAGQ